MRKRISSSCFSYFCVLILLFKKVIFLHYTSVHLVEQLSTTKDAVLKNVVGNMKDKLKILA